MQKTAIKAKSSNSYSRPSLQKSTTLSRRYVHRPEVKKISDMKGASTNKAIAVKSARAAKAPGVATKKISARMPKVAFKTRAKAADLPKAISASAKMSKMQNMSTSAKKKSVKSEKQSVDATRVVMHDLATMETVKPMRKHRGRRIALALGCAATVAIAIGVFVVLNMPNISVKIAAAQTGIDATYPDFVPRDYSMETVASDKNGVVTMKFVGPEGASFTLTEEKSTWDSKAVVNNYVSITYSANYSTMHEQGITYYTEPGSAVWVNGGVLYKITSQGKNLTREQIRNLVVSL